MDGRGDAGNVVTRGDLVCLLKCGDGLEAAGHHLLKQLDELGQVKLAVAVGVDALHHVRLEGGGAKRGGAWRGGW